MDKTSPDHTMLSSDALGTKTVYETRTNYEKVTNKNSSSKQTDSSTVDTASILIDIHNRVSLTKVVCDELIKLLVFVSGMNVSNQITQTTYDRYRSTVVDEFFSMSGLFKHFVDNGFAAEYDNHSWKLIIGKIFVTCNKNDYIVLDDKTKMQVIGTMTNADVKSTPYSKSTINRKKQSLFKGLSKLLKIEEEIQNTRRNKNSSMSTREMHLSIWDIAKKMSLKVNSTEFWCPEGFLTYVLFVDPTTRVIDGLKSYEKYQFKMFDDKKVSSNIKNENANDFISNYENNEVKSQMKLEYYSQHIHMIQNNINSIIADREFHFYYIRHLASRDLQPYNRNDTKTMEKNMDSYNVMLKRKFTELDQVHAKYKSFAKWFDDTEPK